MTKHISWNLLVFTGFLWLHIFAMPSTADDQMCGPFSDGSYGYYFDCSLYPVTGCPPGYIQSGEMPMCCQYNWTPILIDLDERGIVLTSASDGVLFDIDGSGRRLKTAWISAASRSAWLVLDRDRNGSIGNGTELFGAYSPQPTPSTGSKNGFLALAVYDRTDQGGNGDGTIDSSDAIFARLRLWYDGNMDGVATMDELYTLRAQGITGISLDYKRSPFVDVYGNRFRYRAKVSRAKHAETSDRWAWDVYLTLAH